MFEVRDDTFDDDVLRSDSPVVVDFWAPWCTPCLAVEAILAQLEEEHGRQIAFAKLNIDENPVTASRYNVLSIPTTILFEGGEPRQVVVGARPRRYYEEALSTYVK